MDAGENMEMAVLAAARDLGVATILFRNTLAKSLKLNLTETLCLTFLGLRERLSPSDVARLVGLTTGATTTLLDRLEKRGYIRRVANERDRRGVFVELADRYGADARETVTGVQKDHRELIRGYAEGELAVIADFLRRFTGNLAKNSEDVRYVFGEPGQGGGTE